jgi:hypothetical protein
MTDVVITQAITQVTITPDTGPVLVLDVAAPPQIIVQPVGAQGPMGPQGPAVTDIDLGTFN